MALFVLSDPHLANGVDKPMAIFGPHWHDHTHKIESNWQDCVAPQDTVLIPGDISWALTLEEALPDLRFLDALPGTKILSRGNHDFWWPSMAKLERLCCEHKLGTLQFLRNNALLVEDHYLVCGSRGWILPSDPDFKAADARIYARELSRLRLSLESADALRRPDCERIALLHFPPFARDRQPTEMTALLKAYGISRCYYGHIHAPIQAYLTMEDTIDGVRYTLAAADRLAFKPLRL